MSTFLELYGTLLDEALSSDDTSRLFTTAKRKAAINRAQLWFVKQTDCLIRRAEVALSDSTDEYDLESVISAADFLWLAPEGAEVQIVYVSGSPTTYVANPEFTRRSIPWLNRNRPGWRSAADGAPSEWYERREGGRWFFGMAPAPDITAGDTWTAWLPYVVKPADMSADGDLPFTVSSNSLAVLAPWHDALVDYAASKLELLRKDVERSAYFFDQAQSKVRDYKDKQRPVGGRQIQFAEPPYRLVRGSRSWNAGYTDVPTL